jgi:hypothetical protein
MTWQLFYHTVGHSVISWSFIWLQVVIIVLTSLPLPGLILESKLGLHPLPNLVEMILTSIVEIIRLELVF